MHSGVTFAVLQQGVGILTNQQFQAVVVTLDERRGLRCDGGHGLRCDGRGGVDLGVTGGVD